MIFAKGMKKIIDNDIDFAVDTIKIALLKDTYSIDQAAQEFFSHVSSHEAVVSGGGTGYTAGGAVHSGVTVTANPVAGTVIIDADNPTWTIAGGTLTARYAVIYKSTGSNATSPIIGVVDFGENKSATDGNFVAQISSTNGLVKFTMV